MSASIRLHTARLVLRPHQPADLAVLGDIRSRPDVVRHLREDVLERAGAADLLRRRMVMDRLVAPGDELSLVVEAAGRMIGDVSLRWTSAEHHQGTLGFTLHPRAQGHGYATEAGAAVLDLAFDRVRLHRVEARCDARNTAATGVLRRLGLRQEAHLRHNEVVRGRWVDERVFATLEDEWRARRR